MFKNSKVIHEVKFENQTLRLETGLLAKQATSSVVATLGETTVMANVVVGKPTDRDYFPLQVIYEEKMYASGKINGSRFIKREGRPSENAILTGRMVDRSLRSLFDSHIRNEIQLIITILSVDEVNPPDTLAVLAGSTALSMCDFIHPNNNLKLYSGPISAVRIGLEKQSLGKFWQSELEDNLANIQEFSDLNEFLTKVSQTLDISDNADKKYIREIARTLANKNVDWAKEFSKIYKSTEVKSKEEIQELYPIEPKILINPSYEQQENSEVDLVVSGNGKSVMMLEAGANIVSEEIINQCLWSANGQLETLTNFQQEFLKKARIAGFSKEIDTKVVLPEEKFEFYWKQFLPQLEEALYYPGTKEERAEKLNLFKESHLSSLGALIEAIKDGEFVSLDDIRSYLVTNHEGLNLDLKLSQNLLDLAEVEGQKIKPERVVETLLNVKSDLLNGLSEQTKKTIKNKILTEEKRLDGRKLDQVRDILIEINPLPRVHGSSLFQRGETQVLNILTLGTLRDAQLQDAMEDFEESSKRYIHHYNFPSYSVGETGRYGAPGRREIGHGALAEKALLPVLPSEEEFPYTMRLVSECLGSNGSTSMASTCSSCLSLMAGGVPIKDMVAGIAMGLIMDPKTGDFKVLTDIQGSEDHNGDMDFKVTGTEFGVTAIQLDNKVAGLTVQVLSQALLEAKKGRIHILNEMKKMISKPNSKTSPHAPKVGITSVTPDKIGEVIGPSGRNIKGITQKYEVEIEIDDISGKTFIFGKDQAMVNKAKLIIDRINKGYEPGEVITGKVFRTESFGAFVKIYEDGDETSKDGMIHISNLAEGRVKDVESIVKIGDMVKAEIMKINDKGQIELKLVGKE
jgi:polyribonucleotide nucleotidyltransferase